MEQNTPPIQPTQTATPGSSQPAAATPRSGLAIAALVVAIVGAAGSFLPIINNLSFIIALVGLALGIAAVVSCRKGTKRGRGMAVASIIVAVAAIIIVLASQAAYSAALDEVSDNLNQSMAETTASMDRAIGNATETVLAEDVDVQLGAFAAEEGSYGLSDTSLPVTVTNTTDEPKSYNFHIEAVGADGARIADDYVFVNDLGAGQTQNFEAFTYVAADKLDAMKSASFNIVEASAY